jgi:uncharacterized protein YegP (UPF0339 family)
MAGMFELYKDKSDRYRWQLKAGNVDDQTD